MTFRAPLALLAGALVLAGCFSQAPEAVETTSVASTAEDAGAVSGPAPAAPKEAYTVADDDPAADAATFTAYPVALETSGAKAPYVQEFTGTFEPQDCNPTGSGGFPLGMLGVASGRELHELTDALATNDVFSFDIQMAYTNTEQSWASLHLWYRLSDKNDYFSGRTDQAGPIAMNFTGQGFALGEAPDAVVGVDCWYGQITSPIAYTVKVTLSFVEGGVPAMTPVQLDVPPGATRLIVRGVAINPDEGVLSHFRVFAPDDSLVCECALSSSKEVAMQELAAPGKYVVLVDHTANGFVSFALDAPGDHTLVPLATEFVVYPIHSSTAPGPVDVTHDLDLPSTPLSMWAWTFAPGGFDGAPDGGFGSNVKIDVANARGDVLRIHQVGYATYHAAAPGMFVTNDWRALPLDGDWEFFVDHHAYDVGAHTVHVSAEQMRGDALVFAQHYVRV